MLYRDCPRVLVLALFCGVLTLGCKEAAPWLHEGTEGHACFPDETCDPGLVCSASVCVPESGPPVDAGAADQRSRDRLRLDRLDRLDQPRGDKPPITCPVIPPAPSVTSYPPSTSYPKAAVKGIAPGSVKVEVTGGALPQSTPVVGGVFCLEAQLVSGTTNTLKLTAVDVKGCTSAAVFIVIKQGPKVSTNVALGLLAGTKDVPYAGFVSNLTDGQPATSATFSFWDTTPACDEFEHLWFDLGSVTLVDKVNVKYPKSGPKDSISCWKLLASSKTSPADPGPSSPDWKVIAENTNATAADFAITVGASFRHLALLMFEDNSSVGLYETFELGEVEIWGQAPATTCP